MPTPMVAPDSAGRSSAEKFENLFREHYPLVYRTAYSVTGRREDAEDIVQAVFLKLLRRDSPLDVGKNPNAFLYRATLNLSLDHIRRQNRYVLAFDNTFFDRRARPAEANDSEDLNSRLWKAIAELKPSAAQMLILRYVHNYSLTDIAKTLGTTRGTVAVSLFRSRSRLKKLIRENVGGNS
jgi:RNA polymerase sigma factor (sigma-70 family)